MDRKKNNKTPLGTCPASMHTCGCHAFEPFVALACSGYHMSLNVEATTHQMYIGAARVPPKEPISTRSLVHSNRIQHHRTMGKLQSHKKIVIQSDLKRQASMVAKQSVLPSRDPRTVCMTERDLGYLLDSFQANRWPERGEKERLAQLIGKYVYFFSLDIWRLLIS